MRIPPQMAIAIVIPIYVVACGSRSSENGSVSGLTSGSSEAGSGSSTPGGGSSGGSSGGASTGSASSGTGASSGSTGTSGTSAGSGSSGAGSSSGSSSAGGSTSSSSASSTSDASAGGDGGPAPSAGCGTTPTIPSNQYNNGTRISITAANLQRRYILNVPTNYDKNHPYRLVIAFHQRDGNDIQMYNNGYYHLLNLSQNSAIFVAPNGQLNGAPCAGTGSGEASCGWPNPNDSDMLLADAVVAQIEQNFCVDTNRIFATGWSYGASMSYETACERPLGGTTSGVNGYIRAVAAYSAAQLSGSCTPSKPVAYYASHGTGDTVLCYDGASTNCSFASAGGGVKLAQNYATVDGCTWMTPTKVTSGSHVCTSMTGCMTGYPVEFCSFNGPHTPDPTDPGQPTSWEYQTAWNFLSQF